MNLKPNKHKRKSYNTLTMASLGFVGPPKILGPTLNLARSPPPPNLIFCTDCPPPPQLFWSEILRSPLKLGGDCYHVRYWFICCQFHL